MKRGRVLTACVLAAIAAVLVDRSPAAIARQVAIPEADRVNEPWPRIAGTHLELMAGAGIVGSGMVFVWKGAIAARSYQGYQDLATMRPIDENTIYHWASITKTFTGIAIMQLRDRKLLSLDDPVVRFVPELRAVHNPFGDVSQVTIRHLMTHSGGFRAGTWPWGGDKPWHPFEPTRWSQVVAMLPYTEVLFPPGTKYSYSNPGVIFLGRIIESLSGDDYEVYIHKNILMPLGMTRTFFDRAPYHLRDFRSHSYHADDAGRTEAPFDFDSGITVSNGGLNAPLPDMAKYLAFLIGGDETRRAAYDGVLARASLEEMYTRQIRAEDGEGGSGGDVWAGLSCFIERHDGVELVGHSGDQNGFISHLYFHLPSRSGYLVSFNTNTTTKSGKRPNTRAVDAELRTQIVREIFATLPRARS
jgi:CubicO group peptidase (beta-lactamase class C family)